MLLEKDATCFKCQTTTEMIIFGDSMAKPLYYSANGNMFFELVRTGFGGNLVNFSFHFDNPHNGTTGEMECKGDTLIWGKKVFKKVDCPTEINAFLIPEVREPTDLFVTSDGNYILLSRDKHGSRDGKQKLFYGPASQMEQLFITNIATYRDGGTTFISVAGGKVLYTPTPFDKSKMPTFDESVITELNLDDYEIVEKLRTATVTKKGAHPSSGDTTKCEHCHTKNPVNYGHCVSCGAQL